MTYYLTREDAALLEIAGLDYRVPGSREQAYRAQLGLTATQAAQKLNALIDTQAALAFAPQTVARLRRQREERFERLFAATEVTPEQETLL